MAVFNDAAESRHTAPRQPGESGAFPQAATAAASAGRWRSGDPAGEWANAYLRGLLGLDLAAAVTAGMLAFQLRIAEWSAAPAAVPAMALSLFLPLLWVIAVATGGGYARRFIGLGTEEFRRVLSAGVLLTAFVTVVAYASQANLARGYVLVILPTVTLLSLVARYAWRKFLHRLRRDGRCMRRVIVVGHRDGVRDLIGQFRREPYHGMQVIGACLPAEQCEAQPDLDGCPVYGDFSRVPDVVELTGAATVAVLTCPEMDGVELRRLAWQLEKSGTELTVAPALMEVAGPRTTIRPVAGLPLLHVEHPELAGGRRLVKGAFDRLAAAMALLVLSPLLLVLGAVIRCTSPGPILFRQTRVGKDGARFTLYKFRTMVDGAEVLKAALRPRNEHDGVLFKMRADPRVTRVGAWLRRYSLDELPQLINVVLGEMSLVGPRPPLPEEVASYGDDVRRRLVVKPGLTGLWQISGRADLSWEESVRLDLRYVENWSLTLDVQILWKTWSAVIRGAGAY
ncbi:sugar transferase [Salinactinospora qingdaonensis]|uniref:Sugar transferase n=1 Tax=Salinactinospora qingdaonensis TaxID=702744 RepID=A0ABP7FLG5_9ACTN